MAVNESKKTLTQSLPHRGATALHRSFLHRRQSARPSSQPRVSPRAIFDVFKRSPPKPPPAAKANSDAEILTNAEKATRIRIEAVTEHRKRKEEDDKKSRQTKRGRHRPCRAPSIHILGDSSPNFACEVASKTAFHKKTGLDCFVVALAPRDLAHSATKFYIYTADRWRSYAFSLMAPGAEQHYIEALVALW